MIRLTFTAAIFGAGLWAGIEFEKFSAIGRCLEAGGTMAPGGICTGTGGNG